MYTNYPFIAFICMMPILCYVFFYYLLYSVKQEANLKKAAGILTILVLPILGWFLVTLNSIDFKVGDMWEVEIKESIKKKVEEVKKTLQL